MDQHQIQITTVNNRNSTEIEEPAGAAVGEGFNAHEGSKEVDSGSQPRKLNYTSDAQDVREIHTKLFKPTECEIRALAQAKGMGNSRCGLWTVVYDLLNNRLKWAANRSYKAEGSKDPDSGSQLPNVICTIDEQEVQAGEREMTDPEEYILTLAKVKGLKPTKDNLWKLAFKDFSGSHTILQNRIYKREEEMRSVKNEIYQVVGFFSAFQGLLITAAAQSILLRCNNVGFILALSAFATAVAVFGIWQKIMAMEEMRSANIKNTNCIKIFRLWLCNLREHGIDFRFDDLRRLSKAFMHRCMPRKEISDSYGTWLLVSVIVFGGLCMVAIRQIVCNPGHSLPSN